MKNTVINFILSEDYMKVVRKSNPTLSKRAVSMREKAGISIPDVAIRSGLLFKEVLAFEQSRFNPSLDWLDKYSKAIGTTSKTLIEGRGL